MLLGFSRRPCQQAGQTEAQGEHETLHLTEKPWSQSTHPHARGTCGLSLRYTASPIPGTALPTHGGELLRVLRPVGVLRVWWEVPPTKGNCFAVLWAQ